MQPFQNPNGNNNIQPPKDNGEMFDFTQGGNGQNFPQEDNEQGMTIPDNSGGQMGNQISADNTNSYVMLGMCSIVLLIGLFIALIYKKRV